MGGVARMSAGTWLALLVATLALGCARVSPAERERRPLPAALEGVALTAHNGAPLNEAELGGRPLLLSFMFTSCPTVCPAQLRALVELHRRLGRRERERVRFLSISVDPENDTPAELARFALRHGANLEGFWLARASEAGTTTLTTRLAAFGPSAEGEPKKTAHTTAVYLFDARGRLLQRYGSPLDVARLAEELESVANLTGADASSVLD
jgi:protein SCO1